VAARTPRDAATSESVVIGATGSSGGGELIVDRLASGVGRVEGLLVLEGFPEFGVVGGVPSEHGIFFCRIIGHPIGGVALYEISRRRAG
jgi:hypothetical protein